MRLAVLVALTFAHSFGAGATILIIGKPRKPVTHGLALATLAVATLMVGGASYLDASAS